MQNPDLSAHHDDLLRSGLITVRDVSQALRVSKMTTYRLIQRGELPAVRVGNSYRVPMASLRELLDQPGRDD